jgi:hypothetical protein
MDVEQKTVTINAMEATKAYFNAYQHDIPYKKRQDAVRAAWRYFGRFNGDPVSNEAKAWFEENIGKVDL